jgi:hypothetical protein
LISTEAILARNMLRSFRRIKFCLPVGVGSGVQVLNVNENDNENKEDDDKNVEDGKDTKLDRHLSTF